VGTRIVTIRIRSGALFRFRMFALLVNFALLGLSYLLGNGGAWMIDGFCTAILLVVIASFVFEHMLMRKTTSPG
jgi:hypothetical protein